MPARRRGVQYSSWCWLLRPGAPYGRGSTQHAVTKVAVQCSAVQWCSCSSYCYQKKIKTVHLCYQSSLSDILTVFFSRNKSAGLFYQLIYVTS